MAQSLDSKFNQVHKFHNVPPRDTMLFSIYSEGNN